MNLEEIRTQGFKTGFDIAKSNLPGEPVLTDSAEKDGFVAECLGIEQDHFRQFSPFEFFAAKLNAREDFFTAWNTYDNGVVQGIEKAITEHNSKTQ